MNNTRILCNALLIMSGAFLCAESTFDAVSSQIDTVVQKKIDRAMLLELAKAMMELKMATADLKEVKAQTEHFTGIIPVNK